MNQQSQSPLAMTIPLRRFSEAKMDQLLALRINDAARALGVGRTHLYRLINEGKIETIQLGRRRLVKAASLRKLIEEG
ncbi:helix-turn-helix domain-containing protein [Sphingomonas sp.]|uniref:helix-turn-helix domain-containing protein n=1 Tax=Sphingomonas sp. TaxID=28214 RepID=UPI0025D24FDB|nr:helix-turn-helix domain-containing protein [Sphingomonas sp.]